MAKILFLCISVIILTVGGVAAQEATPEATDSAALNWCVSAWFYPTAAYPGAYTSIMDNLDVLDEVNPFWYMPMTDGSVQPTPDAENADYLAAWRAAGIKIVPSIFSNVSVMIEDEATRTIHIEAIRDLVVRMDYDGIDIDYEGFGAHTREPFSLFVEGLSAALHAEGRELSVTVHAKTDEGVWEGARAQDWTRIAPVSEVFRIMTYDYTNRNEPPGAIAPVAWVEDVLTYAASVTDLQRVRMGLPFYGYIWQRGNPPSQSITWSSIQNWINNFDIEIQRDPADMEAFVDFKVPGLPRQVVYIADPEGLRFKLERIAAQFPELGGVSIWGVGGEHPELWDTLQTYMTGC